MRVRVKGRLTTGRSALVGAAAVLLLLAGCTVGTSPSDGSTTSSSVRPSAAGTAGSSIATAADGSTSAPSPSVSGVSSNRPCVGAAQPATWEHVIWIWFENKPSTSIIGSPDASYITTLAASCALAMDYHGITHPSLPNYLAATSGSTNGVADDGDPAVHPLSGPSLFGQLTTAGKQWRSYQEGMPAPCAPSSSGSYAVRHNPAAYYTAVRADCARWDVGLGQLTTDLAADRLPAFSLVTPDLCHDMHDCSVSTGDTWLREHLPAVLNSSAYTRGTTAVLITWDEDDTAHDNRVPLLVVAPTVPAQTRIGTRLDHYSLLRTTEQVLGLPLLGSAAQATTIPGLGG
ncbi:alkaline phosphatase family protein [Cellulomonas sp. T2.31MG-18]|uniref:alkaline phosphatase family protein n=1 Tax=Cellulomonas sp. T2.31MG-18 TaxID=3157619 RepID=UPI0036702167